MATFKWAKQKETWSDEYVCLRCDLKFKELDNIGKWHCAFHPGQKVNVGQNHSIMTSVTWVRTNDSRWSCCNRIWTANHENGCKPCDHSYTRVFSDDFDILKNIPKGWLRELKPRSEAIIDLGGDSTQVNIKRTE